MCAPDVRAEVPTSRASGDTDQHKEKRSLICFHVIKGEVHERNRLLFRLFMMIITYQVSDLK